MTETPAPRPAILGRTDGESVAYHHIAGASPGIVFLGGFRSDMNGSKALALDAWCRRSGRAFTRFDYFAHGASSGAFGDATIGRWKEDALAILDDVTSGPQILVGSSIGGWIMTLAALARPDRIAGLVGIAAAPDATEDLMLAGMSPAQRGQLAADGVVVVPSDYDPAGYPLTRRLIEDGRRHLVLRAPIPLACPVRLLHGMADPDVPWRCSLALAERLESQDVRLHLVKDGDHRLSRPQDLALLLDTIAGLA